MYQIRRHSSINFIINFLNHMWIALFLVDWLVHVDDVWFLGLSVFLNERQIESACQRLL
jgi:hypothetical protein